MAYTRLTLNSTAWPEIVAQYGGIQMLIYALETDLSRNPQSPGIGPFGDDQSSRAKWIIARQSRMLRKQKFNYWQLTPRFTTLELDKLTSQTNTQIPQVSHVFTALKQIVCSSIISKLSSTTVPLLLTFVSLLLHPSSEASRYWTHCFLTVSTG